MKASTGEIFHLDLGGSRDMQNIADDLYRNAAEMRSTLEALVPLTEDEYKELKPLTHRKRKNWMRNKQCKCGSGIKFKKCCWSKFS